MTLRTYRYVGPREIAVGAQLQPSGVPIRSRGDLARWIASFPAELTRAGGWIATFTIGACGTLFLAPRRSEHVACAAGAAVLSAGEITFAGDMAVVEVSNQSTGYCPAPESWTAVESALNRIGLEHPGGFTDVVVFRYCQECNQRNIVKDSWFYCEMCHAELPIAWNFEDVRNAD